MTVKGSIRTTANYKTLTLGESIYRGMTQEQRDNAFSLEGTIHFVNLLGLGGQTSGLVKQIDGTVGYALKVVGVTLVTDIDIEVPVISVLKNKDTGITKEDVSSRSIKAGETFHLNMYEVMMFITRPEYGGFITRGEDTRGIYFTARTTNYYSGKDKLPSPSLNARMGTGALRGSTIEVDEPIVAGIKGRKIKPEYAKEFGALKKKPREKAKVKEKEIDETPYLNLSSALKKMGVVQ